MGSAIEGFEVFVAVCDAGSIAGAARVLGMPRATLSRQLARLEEELGVRLLHRSTRRLVRTAAGEELYPRARRVVEAAQAARDAVRSLGQAPRGRLRISVPPDLGAPVTDFLFGFARRYPLVQLEVHAASAHVDLVGQGFDVALRAGRVADPELVTRRLATLPVQAFASRSYLEARGRPEHVEDLAEHDIIVGMAQGRLPHHSWPLVDGGSVPVEPRLVLNTMRLVMEAVGSGLGIGLIPVGLGRDVSTWELEPVLPDRVGTSSELSLVVVERALMLPRVRAFLDHVVEAIQARPNWIREAGPAAG